MICYIVLHYMAIEETISCVDNLKKITRSGKIIIVDNNSPNNTGKILLDKYKNDNQIFVYLNNVNDGYARGNNIGLKIAKEKYNPDFYVVLNNDIEIPKQNFENILEVAYRKTQFDILGPDIYSTTEKIHQNPKSLKRITIDIAKKTKKEYESKLKCNLLSMFRLYIKQINLINVLYKKYRRHKTKIDFTKQYENVPLHGACVVFSKKMVDKRENVFFPNTFFYYEMEIMDYESQIYGYKEIYYPSLKVYHHHNISTNLTFNNIYKRNQFMNQQSYNSVVQFLGKYDK